MGRWNGYTGNILDVDLDKGITGIFPLEQELATMYMGGKGLGAKMLFDELPHQCDPLSPQNILIFATGPLTGTLAPSSGRFEVCTKSPATGLWLDSNSGGFFGPELKFACLDMIIVRGRSPKPVILIIDADRIGLEDASGLWGRDAIATHRWIKDNSGKDFRVACIGPAGERGVKFASIISEYRALGRGGAGAVMGSKLLKAIAVRGSKGISLCDEDTFFRVCREAFNEISINPDTGGGRQKYGTNVILSCMNEAGIHPVRNFQEGKFEGFREVNEDKIQRYHIRHRSCYGCPIYCSKISKVKSGRYKGSFTEGPEYESVWAFGAQCDNSNLDAIIHAEYLCDYYGMDSISAGNVIGFLMECIEKGMLTESELGISLHFGNDEGMIEALHMIGRREGLGSLWGEGVRGIAAEIQGTERLAMHVKGLELPGYDPRASTGMALAYATSDRGGCHLRAWPIAEELLASSQRIDQFSTEFKAELVKNQQDLFCAVNCSGLCLFATFAINLKQITPFLHSATGIESFADPDEILKIGERVNNLVRLFNLREGLTRELDTLPSRFFIEPIKGGPCEGKVADLRGLLEQYYFVRGWDELGRPTDGKMKEIGIYGGQDV